MNDYPWNLDVYPLTTWPGELTPYYERRRSQFSASWSDTMSRFRTEIAQIGADSPVRRSSRPSGRRPMSRTRNLLRAMWITDRYDGALATLVLVAAFTAPWWLTWLIEHRVTR